MHISCMYMHETKSRNFSNQELELHDHHFMIYLEFLNFHRTIFFLNTVAHSTYYKKQKNVLAKIIIDRIFSCFGHSVNHPQSVYITRQKHEERSTLKLKQMLPDFVGDMSFLQTGLSTYWRTAPNIISLGIQFVV